jgi:hypothetical protein
VEGASLPGRPTKREREKRVWWEGARWRERGKEKEESQKRVYSDFLGVAFFAAAFFFGVVFLGGCGAVDLVTRPDFVCPRTLGWSTTAGAWRHVRLGYELEETKQRTGGALRCLVMLALVLVAAAFLGAAAFLVAAALGAAAFLVVVFFSFSSFLAAVLGAAAFC